MKGAYMFIKLRYKASFEEFNLKTHKPVGSSYLLDFDHKEL